MPRFVLHRAYQRDNGAYHREIHASRTRARTIVNKAPSACILQHHVGAPDNTVEKAFPAVPNSDEQESIFSARGNLSRGTSLTPSRSPLLKTIRKISKLSLFVKDITLLARSLRPLIVKMFTI